MKHVEVLRPQPGPPAHTTGVHARQSRHVIRIETNLDSSGLRDVDVVASVVAGHENC